MAGALRYQCPGCPPGTKVTFIHLLCREKWTAGWKWLPLAAWCLLMGFNLSHKIIMLSGGELAWFPFCNFLQSTAHSEKSAHTIRSQVSGFSHRTFSETSTQNRRQKEDSPAFSRRPPPVATLEHRPAFWRHRWVSLVYLHKQNCTAFSFCLAPFVEPFVCEIHPFLGLW